MTEFLEKVQTFAKQLKDKKEGINNEETTKIALIFPFVRLMGYDTTNPLEVRAEYTADIGAKQGEKVDLAIMKDDKINIIIECKPINTILGQEHLSQLYRYYSLTEAKIGILTNGIIWRFYADSKKQGIMDETPFLEVDLEHPKKSNIEKLENFTKEKFNPQAIEDSVNELKYKHDLKELLLTELQHPSDELTRVLTKQVYDGVATQNVIKQFRSLIKQELQLIIQEKIDKTLNDAIENNEVSEEEDNFTLDKNGIVTTQEEIDAHNIVKSIVSELINPDDAVLKDGKYYCNVLYKNNSRRPIIRFYFNNSDKLSIELFDNLTTIKGAKKGHRERIEQINELFNYKEELLNTIRFYKQIEK